MYEKMILVGIVILMIMLIIGFFILAYKENKDQYKIIERIDRYVISKQSLPISGKGKVYRRINTG